MLEAIRARDLVRLQTLVRQHNQGALQAYLSYLDASEPTAAAESSIPSDQLGSRGSMI